MRRRKKTPPYILTDVTSKWETIKDTFSKARRGTELVQGETGNQSLSWLFESVSPSHQNPVVLAEVCGLLPCQTNTWSCLGGSGWVAGGRRVVQWKGWQCWGPWGPPLLASTRCVLVSPWLLHPCLLARRRLLPCCSGAFGKRDGRRGRKNPWRVP